MSQLLAVFIGGGLGSLARYGISIFVLQQFKSNLPIGTLLANLLSCAILGLMWGVFSDKLVAYPALKLLVVVGFCGGFSTFSTFSYETFELMRLNQIGYALLNVVLSVVACTSVIYLLSRNTVS